MSNGHWIKITTSQLCAADIPATEDGNFLIVVFVDFDAALRIVLWMSDMLKPSRLLCAFNAANRKVAVGYAERTVINLTNFKLFQNRDPPS